MTSSVTNLASAEAVQDKKYKTKLPNYLCQIAEPKGERAENGVEETYQKFIQDCFYD